MTAAVTPRAVQNMHFRPRIDALQLLLKVPAQRTQEAPNVITRHHDNSLLLATATGSSGR
jgi:hypothetical protein